MSPLQLKLERAVTWSISARENRVRLAKELASAVEMEEARHHELQVALDQYQKSMSGEPLHQRLRGIGTDNDTPASGTSQPSDSTLAMLNSFHGLRD